VSENSVAPFVNLDKKKVLLADSFAKARNLRAALMRKRLVDVDVASNMPEALELWRTNAYHLVLVAPRENPAAALELWQEIKRDKPRQRVAFLVGSPAYVSLTWAAESRVPALPTPDSL
jgi:CheY-like chemotaxis protein